MIFQTDTEEKHIIHWESLKLKRINLHSREGNFRRRIKTWISCHNGFKHICNNHKSKQFNLDTQVQER